MTKRERMNAAFDEQIRDMRQAEALGISLAEYHRQKREPRRCRICHEPGAIRRTLYHDCAASGNLRGLYQSLRDK